MVAVWTELGRGLSVIVWSWRIMRKRAGLHSRIRMRTCPRIGPLGNQDSHHTAYPSLRDHQTLDASALLYRHAATSETDGGKPRLQPPATAQRRPKIKRHRLSCTALKPTGRLPFLHTHATHCCLRVGEKLSVSTYLSSIVYVLTCRASLWLACHRADRLGGYLRPCHARFKRS